MKSTAIIALAGAIALGAAALAEGAPAVRDSGGGSGVTRAEFERLQSQVQTLERRVASLESRGGRGGAGGHAGKLPPDQWEGR